MTKALQDAVTYYFRVRKRGANLLQLDSQGYWRPLSPCALCKNAAWSSSSGAHVKSLEHVANLFGVPTRELAKAVSAPAQRLDTEFAWKALLLHSHFVKDADGKMVPSLILKSDTNDLSWIPHSVTLAECEHCDEVPREVPSEACGCGLYAFWLPQPAIEYFSHRISAVVKLRVGGKVIEYDDGCRAQAAVIVGILDCDDEDQHAMLTQVAEIYGVPLVTEEDANDPGYEIIDDLEEGHDEQ